MDATFIGIDLAWHGTKNSSGGAVLVGDRQRARFVRRLTLSSPINVLDFIDAHVSDDTVIAIDAPLIIRNRCGQRPCETEVSKCYGTRHASCHSSNLELYPDAVSVRLCSELTARGFVHCCGPTDSQKGRVMMEVYPHPAIIELFELGSALQYKKGKIEERRRGQQEFQRHLRKLSCFSPAVEKTSDFLGFLAKDVASLRGRALKEYEDELDALVCAYVGYHYWAFRADRSRIFGDVDFGYIVVPMRSPATARSILD